jgi:hypothetical protein
MGSIVTGDDLQSFNAWDNRGRLPQGVPIPWTGKRNRRKHHGRGKGNMLGARFYEVAPSRYCCYGHDNVLVDKGSARKRELDRWQSDWQDEQDSELRELMAYDSFE